MSDRWDQLLATGKMAASPLQVLSPREIDAIVEALPDSPSRKEIAQAIWDYAEICWQRGQRMARAEA